MSFFSAEPDPGEKFSEYSPLMESPNTVCPGSSDPPEKIFSIFASENEVYTIY